MRTAKVEPKVKFLHRAVASSHKVSTIQEQSSEQECSYDHKAFLHDITKEELEAILECDDAALWEVF